jgi:hypothetical protein
MRATRIADPLRRVNHDDEVVRVHVELLGVGRLPNAPITSNRSDPMRMLLAIGSVPASSNR